MSRKNPLGGPSWPSCPLKYQIIRYTSYFRPLRKCFCFSTKGQITSIASVVSLFFWCCPSAIVRCIPLAVINALYLHVRKRPWSHILQKQREIMPPLANSYTSTTVAGEIFGFRVVTSPKNMVPYVVFGCSTEAVPSIFLNHLRRLVSCNKNVSKETSTAPSVSALQITCTNNSFFSTFAPTKPPTVAPLAPCCRGQNTQAPENLTYEILNGTVRITHAADTSVISGLVKASRYQEYLEAFLPTIGNRRESQQWK